MKLKILSLSILVSLSTNASADWFNGWNNANTQGSETGNAAGLGTGSGNSSTSGQGKVSGWSTGKGDADGEIDFSLTFKGKGRSNMDTKISANGATDFAGNAIGDTTAFGNTTGNFISSGTNSNNSGYRGTPWNNSGYNQYSYGVPRQMLSMSPMQSIPPMSYTSPQAAIPIPRPKQSYMPPQQQGTPYGYPMSGYRPAMPVPPQAPSYQEVVKRQQAMQKQLQDQMQKQQQSFSQSNTSTGTSESSNKTKEKSATENKDQ
ncbi:MAG: hypothetical protein V3U84_07665 [Thiotrichaceae bacterium]